MRPGLARRPARRLGFALVLLATLVLHALLADRLALWLEEAAQAAQAPARLQVRLVDELKPVDAPDEPLAAAAPAAPPAARRAAAAVPAHPAASAPARKASAPREAERRQAVEPAASDAVAASASEAPASAAAAPPPLAQAASPPAAPASAASEPAAGSLASTASAAAPAASAAGTPFEWPPSTRLSYRLTGSIRGEVHGSAQVEWLREGDRYQVHLDVIVGPGFAPLVQRRMSSDGRITPQGLLPRRYDERTEAAFRKPRQVAVLFDDEGVTLANGQRVSGLPALQDTASQFVQLIYLFATDPSRLREGAHIDMPLALARRVDLWTYEVTGRETIDTPVGRVPAWHLVPRRVGDPSALRVETWFAPGLQYLPVRIVIRQNAEDYVDLLLERLPLQAGGPAASGP